MIFLVLHRTNDGYIRLCTRFLVVALLILTYVPVFAAQVTFKPSLALSETYTDNVDPRENPGEEDYITEITPNFALHADGNRLDANLGFTLQNFFYLKGSDRYARYHNLAVDASAELIKDFAFLNLGASDYQEALSSSGGLAQNNRNVADRANILTGFINPHFKKRFGGKAEGAASYSYKELRNDGLGVSNTEIEAVQVGLKSGPSFRRMTWSLDYSQETTKRSKASNSSKESSIIAQVGYRVYKKLGLLFRAGDERSDLTDSKNGAYYAGGIEIVPNSTLRIDLLSGDQLDEASISWVPTPRSMLNILWRDKEVGENPGEVWKGTLRLINRRVVWRVSYLEDTTSSAQSLGASASQGTQPPSGNAPSSECALSDEDFLFKRKQMDFGYKTAKSLISVALHKERREFDASPNEKSRGGRVSWRWGFAPRTAMLLSFQQLKDECSGAGRFHDTAIRFSRKMGRGMEGSVIAQFKSGDGRQSYDENSLSAGMKWHF